MTRESDEAKADATLDSQMILGDTAVPEVVSRIADGRPVEFVWRSELGGLTFRSGDWYVKWNPKSSGIDLGRERDRLNWISQRHPAPRVIDFGSDAHAQWLVTEALPGDHAVGQRWQSRPHEAIHAIATGLRALHRIPITDFPPGWTSETWVGREPVTLGPRPPLDDPVIVHGDACAPNTLISASGEWTGNVDFGDLAIGDRWADLAVASLSLDWNFGEGHQPKFFDSYGITPDERRITYYRDLWDLES
ncbi:MAG: aminoglycoside 3'-phosphotransferase [Candidatus Nanopelagicales bacterium]